MVGFANQEPINNMSVRVQCDAGLVCPLCSSTIAKGVVTNI